MVRTGFVGVLLLVIVFSAGLLLAQQPPLIDINSASEDAIAALGIERTVAKKIIESRPFANKTQLVSRQLLTVEQYDKVKDLVVARQPPQPVTPER